MASMATTPAGQTAGPGFPQGQKVPDPADGLAFGDDPTLWGTWFAENLKAAHQHATLTALRTLSAVGTDGSLIRDMFATRPGIEGAKPGWVDDFEASIRRSRIYSHTVLSVDGVEVGSLPQGTQVVPWVDVTHGRTKPHDYPSLGVMWHIWPRYRPGSVLPEPPTRSEWNTVLRLHGCVVMEHSFDVFEAVFAAADKLVSAAPPQQFVVSHRPQLYSGFPRTSALMATIAGYYPAALVPDSPGECVCLVPADVADTMRVQLPSSEDRPVPVDVPAGLVVDELLAVVAALRRIDDRDTPLSDAVETALTAIV